MKNTVKLLLVIVLFCANAFADGNMGGGGAIDDGNMGGGGRTCTNNCPVQNPPINPANNEDPDDAPDSVIAIIQDYLNSIFR